MHHQQQPARERDLRARGCELVAHAARIAEKERLVAQRVFQPPRHDAVHALGERDQRHSLADAPGDDRALPRDPRVEIRAGDARGDARSREFRQQQHVRELLIEAPAERAEYRDLGRAARVSEVEREFEIGLVLGGGMLDHFRVRARAPCARGVVQRIEIADDDVRREREVGARVDRAAVRCDAQISHAPEVAQARVVGEFAVRGNDRVHKASLARRYHDVNPILLVITHVSPQSAQTMARP